MAAGLGVIVVPRREQPPGPGDEFVVRFARDLRVLRERAGSPTYRRLSVRAHYSAAALSEAAGGRKLPSLAVTLAYVAACGGDTAAWKTRWEEIAAHNGVLAGGAAHDHDDDEDAPYVGLAAFQVGDADRFFGRDRLVADLLARVREQRFVGVFGASGSGKSSIMRAGLLAHLAQRAAPAVLFTPGPHPMEECAIRLAAVLGTSPGTLLAEFTTAPRNLHLRIRQAMTRRADDTDLVLVVDQFEELFTVCRDQAERDWLITALTTAASAPASRTRVVLGVRADFYGQCGQYPRLVEALRDAQILVGPMNSEELRRAITEPAIRADRRVESALVAELVAAAAHQPGVLPLISHVLLETWRRRRGTTLTVAGYEAAGGVHGALARSAEGVYTSLETDQQDVARQILLRLCALGEGTEDTKRRIHRTELDHTNPHTAVVLEHLTRARLIVLDHDTVEIAHEALIRHWPRLREWLMEDRDGLRIHRQLTEATAIWHSHDRDHDALYRGTRLALAQNWAAGHRNALTPTEREFLDTSVSAQAHDYAIALRRTRRLRRLVALLVVLVMIATATAIYAMKSQQTADRQRTIAVALGAIRDAADLVDTNPTLAAHISLAAYRLHPTSATRDSLIATTAAATAIPLAGVHNTGATVAPNGRFSAANRWEFDWTALSPMSDSGGIRAEIEGGWQPPRFSPDSRIVATMDRDAVTRLWDVSEIAEPRMLATIPRKSGMVEFSPAGSVLVTSDVTAVPPREGMPASDRPEWDIGGTSRLWDITNVGRPRELGALAVVKPAAYLFGQHRRVIAVVEFTEHGPPAHVTFWNIAAVRNPRRSGELIMDPRVQVLSAVFGQRDRIIYTGDAAGDITVWDVSALDDPRQVSMINGNRGGIVDMTTSSDERSLATANGEGAKRFGISPHRQHRKRSSSCVTMNQTSTA